MIKGEEKRRRRGPRIRRAQEEREKELHRISDSGGER